MTEKKDFFAATGPYGKNKTPEINGKRSIISNQVIYLYNQKSHVFEKKKNIG